MEGLELELDGAEAAFSGPAAGVDDSFDPAAFDLPLSALESVR